MNEILSEIIRIGTLIKSIDSNIENLDAILLTGKCNKSEFEFFLKFDFTSTFKYFNDSLKICFSNKNEPNNFIMDINKRLDKGKDFFEEMFIAHNEIKIDKSKLINFIFDNDILSKTNIKLFFKVNDFVKTIKGCSLNDLENIIFKKDKINAFIILDEDILLKNDILHIIGGINIQEMRRYIVSIQSNINYDKYESYITFRNERCNWIGCTKWLSPDYLYFDYSNTEFKYTYEIKKYFDKQTVNLSIPFIANFTSSDGEIKYSELSGQKKIRILYSEVYSFEADEFKYIYKIYNWIYKDYNSDKLTMVRKIITFILCEECNVSYYNLLIKKSKDIYNSVLDNFDIYLQENVEEYFDLLHSVREMITNKSKDISNEINNLIDNMNKNFLTSIGLVTVAVIGYMSKANIYILKSIALIYGLYLIVNAFYYLPYYKFRFNIIINDYNEHIGTYKKALRNSMPSTEMINLTSTKFNKYWKNSLILLILIILIDLISILYTRNIINIVKYFLGK